MNISGDKLSYAVIGKAMEVHRILGPGVDERFYHSLLAEKLREAGIEYHSKPRGELAHRGFVADVFEPDFVIPTKLVLELKWLWADFAPEHFLQVKGYLKFWRLADALLFDFGKELLVQRRFFFTDHSARRLSVDELVATARADLQRRRTVEFLSRAIAVINNSYGLGYRDTTYRGLLMAELKAEKVPFVAEPEVTIACSTRELGRTRLRCLSVAGECAVTVLSQRDNIRVADAAILESGLRHLGFRWGAIVIFGKKATELRWVSV